MKTGCDNCKRRRNCNTMDRSRGMGCKDYEKEVERSEGFGTVCWDEKYRESV